MREHTVIKDFAAIEEQLFPFLTLRQSLYMAVAGILAWVVAYSASFLELMWRIYLFGMIAGLGVLAGWVKWHDRGLVDWTVCAVRYLRQQRFYIWRQREVSAAELGYDVRTAPIRPKSRWYSE